MEARGWKRPLFTPGKTGLPGVVKPASWTYMAEFSIQLFGALHDAGFPRLMEPLDLPRGTKLAIESFPTSAWRSLKLLPLAGKSKASVGHVRNTLHDRCDFAQLIKVYRNPQDGE